MVHYGWANGGSVYVFFISEFPTDVENRGGGGGALQNLMGEGGLKSIHA